MTNKNMKDNKLPEDIQEELAQGRQLLNILRKRRRGLELEAAKFGLSVDPRIAVELDGIVDEISTLEKQLADLEAKAREFEQIKSRQSGSRQTAIGSNIAQASSGGSATVRINSRTTDSGVSEEAKLFVPTWSVLQSEIQYVDANLALKFADEAQTVNIMMSFMTLFLGAGISFTVSLVTADQPTDTVLLGTATVFCTFLTIVFGLLTVRSWMKAEDAKKLLFKNDNDKVQHAELQNQL